MSTNPPSIFGFWKTIWTSRHGDVDNQPFLCEYSESGYFIQENIFPGNQVYRIKMPCEYSEGRVTHILKPNRRSEYAYHFEGEVLVMTHSHGSVDKLIRGTKSPDRLKGWEVVEKNYW